MVFIGGGVEVGAVVGVGNGCVVGEGGRELSFTGVVGVVECDAVGVFCEVAEGCYKSVRGGFFHGHL